MKAIALSILLIAASIGSYCGIIQYAGNIHIVEDGTLYRSSQLGKTQLEQVIKRYGIKSILNLRGNGAGHPWYDNEIAISKSFDVEHFDYAISASRIVTPAQISDLLKIAREAPKPLLIHCQAGADRTGLCDRSLSGRSREMA